ncbi:MAG: flagellar biosynthesis protein FlhF [Candidatus Margulisiibacteriota bacterium]|jgi:flagellar biosynthesis protein FlhF
MRIKKYQAVNIEDALTQVKSDFGLEAVILKSQNIKKGGILGLGSKSYVEITAGIDINVLEDPLLSLPEKNKIIRPNQKEVAKEAMQSLTSLIKDANPSYEVQINHLEQKIGDMESYLVNIRDLLNQLVLNSRNNNNYVFKNSINLNQMYRSLLNSGFSHYAAEHLLNKVMSEFKGKDLKDHQNFLGFIEDYIASNLRVKGIISEHNLSPEIIFMLGPTGVGKTTTIAKLASYYKLFTNKKVALITIDTYRIAAIEQLKIYADIIKVDLKVVYSHQEFQEALNLQHEYDLIFVDTPGCSPNQVAHLKELKGFFQVGKAKITPYLVLSLTSKWEDLLKAMQAFEIIPCENLILTKFDETFSYGNILDLMLLTNKSISYLTFGQDVPDDFEIANPLKLAKKISENIKFC